MTIERIGVAEAKRRFSELADRVGRGESFMIVSRGRPVVALVPPQRAAEEDSQPSIGLAAFAGALANEWDTVDEDMAEIVAARQQSRPGGRHRRRPLFKHELDTRLALYVDAWQRHA